MTKARDIASASPAPSTVSATELGYLDGVTSAIQTQIDSKSATSHNHDTAYLNQSVIDAKGDLLVGSGNDAYVRVPVGSNNQVLTADSATTSGVKWATADALPSQTGNSGKYLTTNGTTASWGTVTQPLTWTQRRDLDGTSWYALEYNGSNLYVIVGGNGKLATSSDGITWTDRTSGFGTSTIHALAYANGLWVAVGAAGKIATSTDGTTWTLRTSNMGSNSIYAVKYANGVWVAVGEGGGSTNTGGITYSTDGITWTRKSQSITTISTTYWGVIWNGTNWIVVSEMGSSHNYIYASTPSGTWTAGVTNSGQSWSGIYNDGTRTFFVTNGGVAYVTTSTTGASATSVNGSLRKNYGGLQLTYFSNGEIFIIGTIFVSYSSTPVNGYFQGRKFYNYLPSTDINSSGEPSQSSNVIWSGTAGFICAGNQGQIFTSF